jgi:Ca2+-binding EF-hand superfamily protein
VSADGPWKYAFEFEVPQCCECFEVSHDYDLPAREFKALLVAGCGCLEYAWEELLDLGGAGRLTFADFTNACDRVKCFAVANGYGRRFVWNENISGLFECLDATESGAVTLDDLLRENGKHPRGTWWRITVNTNWGSLREVQMKALKLLTTKIQEPEKLKSMWKFGGETEDEDLTTAFSVDRLGIGAHAQEMRTLAGRYHIPVVLVEDVFEQFTRFDDDGSGFIDRDEFNKLILHMHGASDSSEIPASRLRFFWQEATGSAAWDAQIGFVHFLTWFIRQFPNESPGKTDLISNFYSAFVTNRAAAGLAHAHRLAGEKASLRSQKTSRIRA